MEKKEITRANEEKKDLQKNKDYEEKKNSAIITYGGSEVYNLKRMDVYRHLFIHHAHVECFHTVAGFNEKNMM